MKKQCKRKKWPVDINVIAQALSGAAIIHGKDLEELRLKELLALDAFYCGKANIYDLRELADALNVATEFARMNIGKEAMPDIDAAELVIIDLARRYSSTKNYKVTEEEFMKLKTLYEWHDSMRCSVAMSKYNEARKAAANRVKSGDPKVKVLA